MESTREKKCGLVGEEKDGERAGVSERDLRASWHGNAVKAR